MDMNEVITNLTLTKACSIKPDMDSTESKLINLKVKFDGAALGSVFDKAVSGAVIQWQNGPGRKAFDNLKAGQIVEVQFTSPGRRAQIDPVEAIIASAAAANMTIEAYILAEVAKRK